MRKRKKYGKTVRAKSEGREMRSRKRQKEYEKNIKKDSKK